MKIPKSTGNSLQLVTVDGRDFTIPAHTHVFPNIIGLHRNSVYWGADANVWRPSRWIEHFSSTSRSLENETIKTPVKGSYVPWAEGPRICPGKKFSQVEFVAVIAKLLSEHTIEVVSNSSETEEQARARVLSVVRNSDVKLTLQMKRPESVKLKFVKREV
jgi:cytochrome P450